MSQQTAGKDRPALLSRILLRIGVAASLVLAGFGAAAEGCDAALGRSRSGSGDLVPSAADRLAMCTSRPDSDDFARLPAPHPLAAVPISIPGPATCAAELPILSDGPCAPQTDGLDQEHPPQVRVEPRRWGMVFLGSGSKAARCGGTPNRRSTGDALRLALPPLSLQKLYCTWII